MATGDEVIFFLNKIKPTNAKQMPTGQLAKTMSIFRVTVPQIMGQWHLFQIPIPPIQSYVTETIWMTSEQRITYRAYYWHIPCTFPSMIVRLWPSPLNLPQTLLSFHWVIIYQFDLEAYTVFGFREITRRCHKLETNGIFMEISQTRKQYVKGCISK